MISHRFGITERGDAGLHFDEAFENYKKKNVVGAIFVTKAPHLLENKIDILKNEKIIIHCTITGYSGSTYGKILEPNVIHRDRAIEAYKKLLYVLGDKRVVLRIDPIIPFLPYISESFYVLQNAVISNEQRVRISFLDNYRHIVKRLENQYENNKNPLDRKIIMNLIYVFRGLYNNRLHAHAMYRKAVYYLFRAYYNKAFEVCGEPTFNFSSVGCISSKDYDVLGIKYDKDNLKVCHCQRTYCMCAGIKVELLSHKKQCEHKCVYCYWK